MGQPTIITVSKGAPGFAHLVWLIRACMEKEAGRETLSGIASNGSGSFCATDGKRMHTIHNAPHWPAAHYHVTATKKEIILIPSGLTNPLASWKRCERPEGPPATSYPWKTPHFTLLAARVTLLLNALPEVEAYPGNTSLNLDFLKPLVDDPWTIEVWARDKAVCFTQEPNSGRITKTATVMPLSVP